MHPYNRILGLTVLALSFAAGCGSSKKIDVGDTCTLNSDCKSPLTCSMGKCHEGCRASTDCQPGQTCTKVSGIGVCQLPAEADCKEKQCGGLLICAPDLKCRSACQTASTDCMDAQVCVQSLCADKSELDVTTGQLPQLVIADGGLDAQSGAMNPEAGRADTARSTDVAPASPDLRSLSPDTAVASPDTAIMSSLPDASADMSRSTDGNTPDSASPPLPTFDAPSAAFDVPMNLETGMPDVPYTGPCGEMNQPCCAGDTCTGANISCATWALDGHKACWSCGMQGRPCCAGDTCSDSQTECRLAPDGGAFAGKTCERCGGPGQACCSGNKCQDDMAICESGVCCGVRGGPCCSNDLCTYPNEVCALPLSGAGTSKTCQPCGSNDGPCCAGNKCPGGGVCLTTTNTCVACGRQNQPCCEGQQPCMNASFSCSGGTCTCTPPPVPVVTATPGNGQVVLTWPAPPVADSGSTYIYFTINRSVTSGSRYSVLERYGYLNGSGSPTYTDASVANGVTYYYTVSAEQDSCTSAASAEVSAKPSP